jgi:hypothetical protein
MLLQTPERSHGSAAGSGAAVKGAADFVLEIGTEELPPAEVSSAVEQLQERMQALLSELSLESRRVIVQGTPRRLVVQVEELAGTQAVTSEEKRGPPRKRAYDDAGEPTPALVGFCKTNGADIGQVYFQADNKVCSCPVGPPPHLCCCSAKKKKKKETVYYISSVSDAIIGLSTAGDIRRSRSVHRSEAVLTAVWLVAAGHRVLLREKGGGGWHGSRRATRTTNGHD